MRGLGEEVVRGGDEEGGREDEAGEDEAVAREDGTCEGGNADVEESGGEGLVWRDD